MLESINAKVWAALKSDLALQKDLSRGVINVRALARYLIQKHSLEAGIDAVISAIRRFQVTRQFEQEEEALLPLFKGGMIAFKSGMACISVRPGSRAFEVAKAHNLKMITGSKEIKLFCELQILSSVLAEFEKAEINSVNKELCEIAVQIAPEAARTKGVLARLAGELALAAINIEEAILAAPEFIFYVKEASAVQAHKVLLELCR